MKKAVEHHLEDDLRTVEGLVREIEAPGLSLEESIDKYATAMELALSCRQRLNKMTLRISEIRRKSAEIDAEERRLREAEYQKTYGQSETENSSSESTDDTIL